MVVYSRFGDKVTFIAIVVFVAIAFLGLIGIFLYEYHRVNDLWASTVMCIPTQDFQCVLDKRLKSIEASELYLSIIGVAMSYLGVIFGFLATILYKSLAITKK